MYISGWIYYSKYKLDNLHFSFCWNFPAKISDSSWGQCQLCGGKLSQISRYCIRLSTVSYHTRNSLTYFFTFHDTNRIRNTNFEEASVLISVVNSILKAQKRILNTHQGRGRVFISVWNMNLLRLIPCQAVLPVVSPPGVIVYKTKWVSLSPTNC